jgi:Raf kinase inhibitor-like YbhB/YbcL family protein
MPQAQPTTGRRDPANVQPAPAPIKLSSPAFADGGTIPVRHTADGENTSPMLTWTDPPEGTGALALVCEDPDAPSGTFDHWLAWNIGPERRSLEEGWLNRAEVNGVRQGENGFGRIGYGGPKPPPGKPHRYVFRLYALDAPLTLPAGASRRELERALEGHVLSEAMLIGMYGR